MASTNKKKPFKIRSGQKTYGVVVENFEELKTKGCQRLNISDAKLECITEEDGTIVGGGDYFQTLPGHTVLIFKEETRSKIQRLVEHVEAELSGLTIQEVRQSLDGTDDYDSGKKFIKNYLQEQENNEAEEREQDEAWFRDVRSNYRTKSHFMRDKAKIRIRNYFNVTKMALLPKVARNKTSIQGKATSKERAEDVIKKFQQKLEKNNYHAKIFDRTDNTGQRICDTKGLFCCQGLFGSQSICSYDHEINPYLQWQFVLEFSSWNLDHQIEKSKEVIPELKNAINATSKKACLYLTQSSLLSVKVAYISRKKALLFQLFALEQQQKLQC